MSKKSRKKSNFEILFKDSPEYFGVDNARMFQEGDFVRFVQFGSNDEYIGDSWFPIANIHRIQRNVLIPTVFPDNSISVA